MYLLSSLHPKIYEFGGSLMQYNSPGFCKLDLICRNLTIGKLGVTTGNQISRDGD